MKFNKVWQVKLAFQIMNWGDSKNVDKMFDPSLRHMKKMSEPPSDWYKK